mmetsp:Transcript_15334/g.33111  ORF Transcript_15334/g.33111 Transcript_15334/m.33111 type:complete len:221 (-) Transcript_15334:664-1326(-)
MLFSCCSMCCGRWRPPLPSPLLPLGALALSAGESVFFLQVEKDGFASGQAEGAVVGSGSSTANPPLRITSSRLPVMALQYITTGRMRKGSSIWTPMFSSPRRRKAMKGVAMHVTQSSCGHSASGRKVIQIIRYRAVCRVYASGTGVLKIRSQPPVQLTYMVTCCSISTAIISETPERLMSLDMAIAMVSGRCFETLHFLYWSRVSVTRAISSASCTLGLM